MPTDFLQNTREEIRSIITKQENTTRNQNDADDNYADSVHMIKQEMYQKVNYKKIKIELGKTIKKTTKKPWLSEELTVIWNELCVKEKTMLRSEIKSRRTKRDEFLRQRKVFNREVKKAKRKFWKKKQTDRTVGNM